MQVNLSGAFYLCRAVLQHMLDRGSGRIINISSIIGEAGNIGQASYAAAKSGLFGLTMSGRDLAATPGKVVFRNDLMELLQYSPQTEQVHEIPLLFGPPWINKYYMMDPAPGRSLVEWAVRHGFTVFAISYRNPDESMRDVQLDDYSFLDNKRQSTSSRRSPAPTR